MSKNLWLFSLTSFLTDASSEIIFPILPLLLSLLGASTIDIGFIEGLSEFLSNMLRIPAGNLASVYKAKPLIIGGYLTSAISKSLYISSILLNTWFFVLVGRSLDRVGKAIRTPARDGLLSYANSKNKVGITFGIHRTADTLGALLGSLFVLWFFYKYGSNEISIKHLIVIALIPAFLAIIPLLFVYEKEKDYILKHQSEFIPKTFYVFCIMIFLCTISNFSYAFYILLGKSKNLSYLEISIGYVIFNIFYALFGMPVGKIYDKIKTKHILFSFSLMLLAMAQFMASVNFYIGFLIFGIFNAFYDVVGKSMVSLYGVSKRSKAYGIYGFSSANAVLFANIIVGILSKISLENAFRIEAVVSISMSILWLLVYKKL